MPMHPKQVEETALDCVYSFVDDLNRLLPLKKDYCKTNESYSNSMSVDDKDKVFFVFVVKFYEQFDPEDVSYRSLIELCHSDEST